MIRVAALLKKDLARSRLYGPRASLSEEEKREDMADTITVSELPKPSGMSQGHPQSYEITVEPAVPGGSLPQLPFLHKEDGITTEDGTSYWITSARQVPVKGFGTTRWKWVYRATRDTSNDPDPWDDEGPFGVSRFGR